MSERTNGFVEVALAYAKRGIPVSAAYPAVRMPRRSRLLRRQWECRCGFAGCVTPAQHAMAAGTQALTRAADVVETWNTAQPPNLMISPSTAIDIWDVPREIGALGMRLLEAQRPSVWPPTMQTPTGRWIMCTLPLDGAVPEVEAYGTQVVQLPASSHVLVPPSRRPGRKLGWVWSHRFPHTPLPDPWQILTALATAAERLHPWEVRSDAATVEIAAAD